MKVTFDTSRWDTFYSTTLKNISVKPSGALLGICDVFIKQAEGYAKNNARWQNRTGDARRGLTGRVETEGRNIINNILSYDVYYGVYLELSYGRKYAIVEEAIRSQEAFLQEQLDLYFRKLAALLGD